MSKPAKQVVGCPLCGNVDSVVLYEPWNQVDDIALLYGAASGVPGTQCLVKCVCGMIYESPRFPDEVILKGYETSIEAGHDSQYAMRVDSFFRALKKLEAHLPDRSAKVLDIGTAGGAFLDAAKQFGYQPIGLEPSKDLVERARERGLDVRHGTIDTCEFQPESFDLITLWDVIEHLTDPKAALKKIRMLLKPNGKLIVNYPDIGTWQAKIAGKKFWWIISVHLHHFTRSTITKIFNATGFETICFKPYWQTLQFGYLEQMAVHYRVPLAASIKRLTPKWIQTMRVPYYASQTTALAVKES